MFGLTGELSPSFGTKRSEETRQKLRELKLGEKNNRFGTHHTPETLEKMRRPKTYKEYVCPYCAAVGSGPLFHRYHLENCQHNVNRNIKLINIENKTIEYGVKSDILCSATSNLYFIYDSSGIEVYSKIRNLSKFCKEMKIVCLDLDRSLDTNTPISNMNHPLYLHQVKKMRAKEYIKTT